MCLEISQFKGIPCQGFNEFHKYNEHISECIVAFKESDSFLSTVMAKQPLSPKGSNSGHITKPLSVSPYDKEIFRMIKPKCHAPRRKNNKLTGKPVVDERIACGMTLFESKNLF